MYVSSLKQLIKPSFGTVKHLPFGGTLKHLPIGGTLKHLSIGGTKKDFSIIDEIANHDDADLLESVVAPSSVKYLTLWYPKSFSSLSNLKTNTCLTCVVVIIKHLDQQLAALIADVLKCNCTLQELLTMTKSIAVLGR